MQLALTLRLRSPITRACIWRRVCPHMPSTPTNPGATISCRLLQLLPRELQALIHLVYGRWQPPALLCHRRRCRLQRGHPRAAAEVVQGLAATKRNFTAPKMQICLCTTFLRNMMIRSCRSFSHHLAAFSAPRFSLTRTLGKASVLDL